MADYWPAANGVWSNLSNWLTATGVTAGNLPTINDNVYADGKTVTIDIDATASTIFTTQRTGGTAGGSFTFTSGVTLTANVLAGTTACLLFAINAPSSSTLVGNVTGSATTTAGHGISQTGTGTLTIFGDIMGGGAGNGPYGISCAANTATINVFGNVYGRPGAGVNCDGIQINAAATLNVTGNVVAGSGNTNIGIRGHIAGSSINILGDVFGGGGSCSGVSIGSTNSVSVTGNVFGSNINGSGYGINNGASGSLTMVYGNVTGGSASVGIRNSSTGQVFCYGNSTGGSGSNVSGIDNVSSGFVYITKVVGNDFGLGSVGIGGVSVGLANSQNGRAYVEQFEFGPRGATPITGPVYVLPSNQNTLTGRLTALGNTVTFYNSLSVSGLLPPVSSVQAGVVYNVGNSTGTMAVPSASAVQFGVPVDNTVGTAALTPQSVWGYSRLSATEVDSMGDRLRNTATTQSVGYQIASFNL